MDMNSVSQSESVCWKVLCVDDEPSILRSLRRMLPRQSYQVFTAESGAEGLDIMASESIDLVISDMRMPSMSGAEFLQKVAGQYPDSVRVLLTGYSDIESTIAAVNKGRIHRYVQKPWETDELLDCLSKELDSKRLKLENQRLSALLSAKNEALMSLNAELESTVEIRTQQIRTALADLKSSHQQVKEQVRAIIRVFFNLLSLKGTPGSAYSQEVSQLCYLIANQMDLSDLEKMNIKLAGLLSEVGVLCLDDRLTSQKLFHMNAQERDEFQSHATLAFRAMSPVQHLSSIAHSIAHQFERFDGKNNFSDFEGDHLPLGSRVLAVARDYIYAVQGVTADTRLSRIGAVELLNEKIGLLYDPVIVQHLISVLPELELDHVEHNERVISSHRLIPGMKLSRDVVTANHLLLLPEGHVLNTQTIKRVQSYVESANEILRMYVLAPN